MDIYETFPVTEKIKIKKIIGPIFLSPVRAFKKIYYIILMTVQ